MSKIFVLTLETEYTESTTHVLGVFTKISLAKKFAKPLIQNDMDIPKFKNKMPKWDGLSCGFAYDDVGYIYTIEEFKINEPD